MSGAAKLAPATALALATAITPLSAQQPTRTVDATTSFDTLLAPGAIHRYVMTLGRGESVNVVVTQMGVDVVVDIHSPSGALLGTVDSPNGRQGDEPVEIIAAESGAYRIEVKPFDEREPVATYRLRVTARRDAAGTSALLAARKAERDSAAAWLRVRSVAIPSDGKVRVTGALPPLDVLARRARVIGIGEATHGSREFNDFRVALTRRLVERFGYRVVAIEASADHLAELNAKLVVPARSTPTTARPDVSWIGVRAREELVRWVRSWNAGHPRDRVTLVGVDPQESSAAQRRLAAFVARAYGEPAARAWAPVARELLAADSQVAVFGDSYVSTPSRQAILELVARLELDTPMLRATFGAAVDSARSDARQLAEFADFNGDGGGTFRGRSRDWYMAARVLEAIQKAGPRAKAVYWAHNAHVASPAGRSVAGTHLRAALGCDYAALGVTFGEGSFVAQIPNDSADRLHVASLPMAPEESVDGVLATIRAGASAASWPCGTAKNAAPTWLRSPRQVHWVGGLHAPGTVASTAFRPFDLLGDFDGVVYFPHVQAEPLPPARP